MHYGATIRAMHMWSSMCVWEIKFLEGYHTVVVYSIKWKVYYTTTTAVSIKQRGSQFKGIGQMCCCGCCGTNVAVAVV